jgi:hypothetical protein
MDKGDEGRLKRKAQEKNKKSFPPSRKTKTNKNHLKRAKIAEGEERSFPNRDMKESSSILTSQSFPAHSFNMT